MARPSNADLRAIDDVAATLLTFREGAPDAIADCMPTIAEIFEADKTLFHSLERDGEGFAVPTCEGIGFDGHAFREAFRKVVGKTDGKWAVYDPSRPAAWDRNRIIDWDRLRPHYPEHDPPPVVKALFVPFRLRVEEQVRALICDGPSLLGWLGGFWSRPPSVRAKTTLTRLIPHFRRRLLLERATRTAPLMRAALHATMEAIGAPAFLVAQNGAPIHVNEAGRVALDRNGADVRERLRRAVQAKAPVGMNVTPVVATGAAAWFLIVENASPTLEDKAASLGKVWALSARQRDVLSWLAQGHCSARIGAELGISDRTVEAHIAAIFEKAQVSSRAALVARIASHDGG
ncbi:MAG: hypothetical protein HOW73_05605 [Polyangiaceae bacterium]|nr:hypothetical protein [Polyangiaceae bacterium]